MGILAGIKKLMTFIFDTAARHKHKTLSYIKRTISRSRYRRFYVASKEELNPDIAIFFMKIFKWVYPFKKILKHPEKSQALQQIIFDYCLDVTHRSLLHSISKEVIEAQSQKHDPLEFGVIVEGNIALVKKNFRSSWFRRPNKIYNEIFALSWLINFDYKTLIGKFAKANISASNTSMPATKLYRKVKVISVMESLKDFLAVTSIAELDTDWNDIFNVLKQLDNTIPTAVEWVDKMVVLQDVLQSEILTLIIQHGSANPEWENQLIVSKGASIKKILDDYITEAKYTLKDILLENEYAKIEELSASVFNEDGVVIKTTYAQFYSEEKNQQYIARGFSGFTLTRQFNYMLTFLTKYYGKIKTLTDLYLIKGLWCSREFPSELSANVLELNEIYLNLVGFDHEVSEQGKYGSKIKPFLINANIGSRSEEQINRLFNQLNDDAKENIAKAIHQISILNTCMEALKNDECVELHTILHNHDALGSLVRSIAKDTMPIKECSQKIEALLSLIHYLDNLDIGTLP